MIYNDVMIVDNSRDFFHSQFDIEAIILHFQTRKRRIFLWITVDLLESLTLREVMPQCILFQQSRHGMNA